MSYYKFCNSLKAFILILLIYVSLRSVEVGIFKKSVNPLQADMTILLVIQVKINPTIYAMNI